MMALSVNKEEYDRRWKQSITNIGINPEHADYSTLINRLKWSCLPVLYRGENASYHRRCDIKKNKMSIRNKILKDVSLFSVSSYIVQFIAVMKGFIAAKLLGPQVMGYWAALMLIYTYGICIHFGILTEWTGLSLIYGEKEIWPERSWKKIRHLHLQ